MRKLHNVTDVNLASSTEAGSAGATTTTGSCNVQWTASLTFQPETAPTVSEPVPARLGGGQ
jgi:hypothetical protein